MTGVIEKFLPHVATSQNRLPLHIRDNRCLAMARRYSLLVDELAKARMATLGAVTVTADGGVQVVNQPGMSAIQARISELEPKIARLLEISSEMEKIFDSEGCDPMQKTTYIETKLHDLRGATQIAPAIWQRLNNLHSGKPNALPSELMSLPEYHEYEKELVARRDAAAAKIPPLEKKTAELEQLATEALSL